jgi:hypothetical protein
MVSSAEIVEVFANNEMLRGSQSFWDDGSCIVSFTLRFPPNSPDYKTMEKAGFLALLDTIKPDEM